jgi:hypothetical protein
VEEQKHELTEYGHQVTAAERQYRHHSLRESLTGPFLSVLIHIGLIGTLVLLMVGKPYKSPSVEIEVSMEPLPHVELEPDLVAEEDETEPEQDETPPEAEFDVPDDAEDVSEAFEQMVDQVFEEPPVPEEFNMADLLNAEVIGEPAPEVAVVEQAKPNLDWVQGLGGGNNADVGGNAAGAIGGIGAAAVVGQGPFGGRSAGGRDALRKKFGGDPAGEDAIMRALRWLQKVQAPDGSWHDEAYTGMALLCFLAHGETPIAEEFGDTVERAMRWLAPRVPVVNGRSDAYKNGIATYAIAEACGMTRDSSLDVGFAREAMDRGLKHIIAGQQDSGGFDYAYAKGERWDLSVVGWQCQALKAGYNAGSEVSGIKQAMKKSANFVRNVTYNQGHFGYSSKPAQNAEPSNMSGVGALILQLLESRRNAFSETAVGKILIERLPGYKFNNSSGSLYGWYYDTQAVFNAGGYRWKKWNKVFQPELMNHQHPDGYWTVEGGHFKGAEGRVFATTLCLLQLQVYYRYLPSDGGGGHVSRPLGQGKKRLGTDWGFGGDDGDKPEDDDSDSDNEIRFDDAIDEDTEDLDFKSFFD